MDPPKRKRCPNGTRRNKKSGLCEVNKNNNHNHNQIIRQKRKTVKIKNNKPSKQKQQLKQKRCPNGTKRNKKSGLCEPKDITVSKQTVKITHHDRLSEYMRKQMKQNTKSVQPYICVDLMKKLMMIDLMKRNKNSCVQDMTNYTIQTNKKHLLFFKMNKKAQKSLIEIYQNKLKKCKSSKKIMVIPIRINNYHFNFMIFNAYRNEIERFEPHGSETGIKEIDNQSIERDLKKFSGLVDSNMKYIPSNKNCPPGFRGYQAYDREQANKGKINNIVIKEPGGYCCAWGFFYADLRMKYPRLPRQEIIDKSLEIIGHNPKVFREFIKGQISRLDRITKQHSFDLATYVFIVQELRNNKTEISLQKFSKLRDQLKTIIDKEYQQLLKGM